MTGRSPIRQSASRLCPSLYYKRSKDVHGLLPNNKGFPMPDGDRARTRFNVI